MTTKICPFCGEPGPIPLRSLSIKYCVGCNKKIEWPLEENEPPVLEGGRAKPTLKNSGENDEQQTNY